jgi:predicted peptidase
MRLQTMKKTWFLLFVLIVIIVSILYVYYRYRGRILHLYLTMISHDLVFRTSSVVESLNYRLYTPKNKSSEKLPLIVYLHGAGQRGEDNKKQLDYVFSKFTSYINQKKHPCFVIAPQCPLGKEWVNRSNKTIPYTHYSQDDTKESEEMKLIIQLIQKCISEYPVDANRIYISGFSMGATGTWDILTRYPDVFAAAAIFAGVSDTTKADLITHIPILAFSGENDNIAPAKLNETMCKSVNALNGNCKFIQFEDVDHGCVSTAFESEEIIKWMFSHKRK